MLYNTRTYNADRIQPDSVVYTGSGNTFSTTDKVELKRAYPKPAGNFLGVAKPTAKQTKTVTVNSSTGETKDAILMLSGSLPVGMAAADIEGLLADMAAFCASNDAKALFKSLDINV